MTCGACGDELPARRREWCSDACGVRGRRFRAADERYEEARFREWITGNERLDAMVNRTVAQMLCEGRGAIPPERWRRFRDSYGAPDWQHVPETAEEARHQLSADTVLLMAGNTATEAATAAARDALTYAADDAQALVDAGLLAAGNVSALVKDADYRAAWVAARVVYDSFESRIEATLEYRGGEFDYTAMIESRAEYACRHVRPQEPEPDSDEVAEVIPIRPPGVA